MKRMTVATPMNVAPRGLPIPRSCLVLGKESFVDISSVLAELLSRKSWLMAIPIDAKVNEVRNQAKNVLSVYMQVR